MRIYTIEHEIAALLPTAGDGVLVVESASTKVLKILRTALYNLDNDTHEQLAVGTFPVATKGSLAGGGSAPTPRKHDPGDANFSGTIYEGGNGGMSTEPSAWGDPFDEQGFSNLVGYEFEPPSEPADARPVIPPSGLFGIRMMAAPSSAFKAKIVVTLGEIG